MGQVGLALVVVGAFSKSAQVPLHFWLPGAMAAPTPVSAYLHSATMVKAGVILIARFAPAAAVLGWWRPLLVIVGGTTMLLGGVAALRRDDAKQSLAFGTVSQLGFLVVLVGIGDGAVTAAGVAWLLAHACFKCALFLTIGVVDHATGSRDLRRLSGVGRSMPVLAVAAALCTLSMVGLPPLVGFAAKEAALDSLLEGRGAWFVVAVVAVVAGSILTTAYSVRLWWGLFATKRERVDVAEVHHAAPWSTSGSVVLLAVASLAAGIAATPLARRLDTAVEAVDESAHAHLTLWAGFHLPLLLSVLIVAAGTLLGAAVWRHQLRPPPPATLGERAYGRSYGGLLDGARRLTAVTQSGSLPGYIAVIFAVVVLVIGVALAHDAGSTDGTVLADSAMQVVVALVAVALSIAVVASRRRFVSVLLLGGVGQALTVLFLMYGAPDLALTQFMIETMGIVAFVLVLRHLPRDFSAPPTWAPRAMRIGIAVASGVAVAWFALVAGSVDRPTDVRDDDGAAVAARGRRAQRGQRRGHRLPRRGHDVRDHRVRHCCARRGQPGERRSAPRRSAAAEPAGEDRRRVDGLRAGDADDLPPHAAGVGLCRPARAQRAGRRLRRRADRRGGVRLPHPRRRPVDGATVDHPAVTGHPHRRRASCSLPAAGWSRSSPVTSSSRRRSSMCTCRGSVTSSSCRRRSSTSASTCW